MKKKILFVLVGVLIWLAGCAAAPAAGQSGALSKQDLEGCELFVYNVTCPDIYAVRTVSDTDFLKKVIDLSVTAEYFRPVTSVDIKLGINKYDPHYVFDNGQEQYTVGFFEVEKQLDIGFVHRDKPIVTVSKRMLDRTQSQEDWAWRCTMSAADYAELFDTVQTYGGGDILKK